MHAAAVQWIASLLRDPATGVQAVLTTLSDDIPDAPAVRPVTVFDELTHAWLAYGTWPQSMRKAGTLGLTVRAVGEATTDAVPNNSLTTCRVALTVLAVVEQHGAPASEVRREAAFVLRAAQRVIARAIPDEVTAAGPVVFGCQIVPPQDTAFTAAPMYDAETLQGGAMLDALVVAVSLDDPYAKGFDPDTPA